MPVPVVALCGIGADAACWRGMPVDTIHVPLGTSIGAMADAILASLPPRFALAGHSMGGYVALAIAARAPDRLAGLALLSTSCAADSDAQRTARGQLIEQARTDYGTVADRLAAATLGGAARDDAALRDTVRAMMLRGGSARFIEQQTATMARPDQCAALAAIAAPAMILSGADDRIVAPARSHDLAAAIPDAVLTIVAGCGHMPPLEAAEATRGAMLAWRARL